MVAREKMKMSNRAANGEPFIPPASFDYPEGGSGATIRVSFTGRLDDTSVPSTAFFARLEEMLPVGEPLRIEEGDWDSYEIAKKACWKIAEELDQK